MRKSPTKEEQDVVIFCNYTDVEHSTEEGSHLFNHCTSGFNGTRQRQRPGPISAIPN